MLVCVHVFGWHRVSKLGKSGSLFPPTTPHHLGTACSGIFPRLAPIFMGDPEKALVRPTFSVFGVVSFRGWLIYSTVACDAFAADHNLLEGCMTEPGDSQLGRLVLEPQEAYRADGPCGTECMPPGLIQPEPTFSLRDGCC
jgi:hypothetical protein